MTLRTYQKKLYDEIIEGLKSHDRVLAQADTGFGKSILIGELANNLKGRTLVLTHRIELLNQNSEWINDLGVLTSKVKKHQSIKDCKNVISMAQTLAARFSKFGGTYLGDFDNVICDEVHVDFFKTVYSQLGNIKLIAFTATPVINKTEKKKIGETEMVRKLTLKDEFDFLCQGAKTKELIEMGFLTQDMNIQLVPPNLKELVSSNSSPDGYTSKSLGKVFGSHASLETVMKGYLEFAKGKKTIIFNPTTSVNKLMHDFFTDNGIETKMFDSVNKVEGQTRKGITDWFKKTDGGILLNVGVFTTGFSVDDLEVIIYNKKTKSLSLWLQSIGRGSRILKKHHREAGKIKDKFIVLDMGMNIETHGRWSDSRNWQKYFVINPWKQKMASDMMQMWECKSCGFFNIAGTKYCQDLDMIVCDNCNEPKEKQTPKLIKGVFVLMDKPPIPTAEKIIKYTKLNNEDGNFTHRLAIKMIVDLFIFHTTKEEYIKRKSSYMKRVSQIYRPIYFAIMNDKDLNSSNKTLLNQLSKITKKVEVFYGFL